MMSLSFSRFAFTVLLGMWVCGAARAADTSDLTTQAITLLHPHYVASVPGKMASVDGGITLLGEPSFKEWHPAVSPLRQAGGGDIYLLALAERNDRPNEGGYDVELGLFALKSGKLSLIAHGDIDSPDLVTEQGILTGVELDLAPYKINDVETAFGVCMQSTYQSTGAHISGENLYLIRAPSQIPAGDDLYPIFDAPVGQSDDNDAAKGSHKANLIILPHKTNGFYDLQVRDGRKATTYLWDEASSRYEDPNVDQSN